MAIEMVRTPSETPNVSNTDDFVGLRYTYGNQNGYVISKGQECSCSLVGSIFKINSGRLVLQGVEVDIDANGVEIAIDNVATTRYYTVYLQINLALNETKILATYDTATYPTIDAGDDLTENITGVARLQLYRFTATSGIISDVNKLVESIKYTKNIVVNNSLNSYKINNLEIKQDENGNLILGDNIIPQKKLLYNDTIRPRPVVPEGSGTVDIDLNNITLGKTKVEFQMISGTHVFYQKMLIGGGYAQSFCWDNKIWDAYYDDNSNKFIINQVSGKSLTFVRCWEIID